MIAGNGEKSGGGGAVGEILAAGGEGIEVLNFGNRGLKVLITEPIIPNPKVTNNGKGIKPLGRNADGNTEVIIGGMRRDGGLPRDANRGFGGDHSLGGRGPIAGGIFAVDLRIMLPKDTRRNEEIINIEVHVVHDRTDGRIAETGQNRRFDVESVAGENLIAEEGDELPLVEAGLDPAVAVKSGPLSIEAGRIAGEIVKKTWLHNIS